MNCDLRESLLDSHVVCNSIIILYNINSIPTTMKTNDLHSDDTLGNTPFQLISGFFHVNQGV